MKRKHQDYQKKAWKKFIKQGTERPVETQNIDDKTIKETFKEVQQGTYNKKKYKKKKIQ